MDFRTGAGAQELGAVGVRRERLRLPLACNPGFLTDEKGGGKQATAAPDSETEASKGGAGPRVPSLPWECGQEGATNPDDQPGTVSWLRVPGKLMATVPRVRFWLPDRLGHFKGIP